MAYKIVFRDEARKTFERLDRAVRQQVGRVLTGLGRIPGRGRPHSLWGILGRGESGLVTGEYCTRSTTMRPSSSSSM